MGMHAAVTAASSSRVKGPFLLMLLLPQLPKYDVKLEQNCFLLRMYAVLVENGYTASSKCCVVASAACPACQPLPVQYNSMCITEY